MTTPARKFMTGVACAAAFAITLTGCAANGDAGAVSAKGGDTVTLVVHDSFPNEDFAKAASEASAGMAMAIPVASVSTRAASCASSADAGNSAISKGSPKPMACAAIFTAAITSSANPRTAS